MDALRAQDALMDGQARFEKWQRDFAEQWQKPVQQAQLRAYWAMLPAGAKDALKAQSPEQYARLEQFISENDNFTRR